MACAVTFGCRKTHGDPFRLAEVFTDHHTLSRRFLIVSHSAPLLTFKFTASHSPLSSRWNLFWDETPGGEGKSRAVNGAQSMKQFYLWSFGHVPQDSSH